MKTNLGQHVTDKLTQHTGIITARCEYLDATREAQALVTARRNDLVTEHWLDESRLAEVDPIADPS